MRYRQLTGAEVNEMGGGITELCTYLYCSVAAACSREKIDFDMELLPFADSIDVEELNAWVASLNEGTVSKKKTPKKQ